MSFSIQSPHVKQILLFRYYQFNHLKLEDELVRRVETIVKNEDIFKQKFTAIHIEYISQKSTLVPFEYFKPENLKKYFEFSQNMGEYDEIHYTKIDDIQAYSVFTVPSHLATSFHSLKSKATFHHQSASLIHLGARIKEKSGAVGILGMNIDFFDLALFQNSKLLLYNTFQYANINDLIYFLLFACQQLRIDPKELKISILGEAFDQDKILEQLKQHIKRAEKAVITPAIDIKPLQQEILLKYYFHFVHGL
jgi:hypothetical protein